MFFWGMGRNVNPSLLLLPRPSMLEPEPSPQEPLFVPQLMICNAVATVLYITAFVTCAAAVQPTSWRQWDYNRRAAASVSTGGREGRARAGAAPRSHGDGCVLLFQFFACVTMITYGVSTFFSFRAWKGLGSNAATSQVSDHA